MLDHRRKCLRRAPDDAALEVDVDGDGRLVVTDFYFQTAEARVSDYAGTYVQTKAAIGHTVTPLVQPRHRRGVTALLEAGLTLTCLAERDTVPWRQFSGETMVSAAMASGGWPKCPSGSFLTVLWS
jgi:hypothetical protein